MNEVEQVQNIIKSFDSHELSTAQTFRHIRKIVKALHEFASDSNKLPPQSLIPCCLFKVPEKFKSFLGVEAEEPLTEVPEKLVVKLTL